MSLRYRSLRRGSVVALLAVAALAGCSSGDSPSTSEATTAEAPTLTFAAAPASVTAGGSSTLTWSSTNATSCTASGGWNGSRNPAGSEQVSDLSQSATYTLSCSGAGGSVERSATVTVTGGTDPTEPTVSLSANPTSVSAGGSTTLTWSSTNATSCTASGGWTGTKATSGNQQVTNLMQSTTFTLACSGAGGLAQQSTQVAVGSSSPAPTVSLSANPSSIASGGATTLTWSSTNATSCTASGGWNGAKATSGNQQVSNLTQNTTFTLACSGTGGSAQQSVQVSVGGTAAPTVTLTAAPASVSVNGTSTLSWSSTNASSCTASNGWSGSRPTSGSASVGPLAVTTNFTLVCTGPGGSAQRSVTVTVTGSGSNGVSGAVDSRFISNSGDNRVYVYEGSVTPDDDDGDSGDPAFTIPVTQDQNACTFSYSLPSLATGTYTLAFTSGAAGDRPGVDDALAFVGTQTVTVGATGTTHNFVPSSVLRVGSGRQYSTIAAAAAAASAGAVIEVDAGEYADDIVVWRANNVVVRGVGGRAHVRGTQVITFSAGDDRRNGMGLWVVRGTGMRVENIEFSGARVTDENGAGIRNQGRDLTICNGYFHDNENGILGGAYGTLLIEYTEFARNGFGDGFTHNLYIDEGSSQGDQLIFRHNYSHHARIGHNLKTRARVNYVLYNRIMDEADGNASYAIDVPNGGLTYVIGNLVQQGPNTDNAAIINYGSEGLSGGRTHELYLVNNTIVNDRGSGTFVQAQSGTSLVRTINNLFVGSGTLVSGAAQQATTNLQTASPGLLDRTGFDYRLSSSSPARNAGTAPGSAGSQSLEPVYHYEHPARRRQRTGEGQIDIGAYEYEP